MSEALIAALNRPASRWFIPGSMVSVAGCRRQWQVTDVWLAGGALLHEIRNLRDPSDTRIVKGTQLEPRGFRPRKGGS